MFKIDITDSKAQVYTPYNATFVHRIKNIGGAKWDAGKKCWTIPADAVDTCRDIMRDVYGRCDLQDSNTGKMLKLKLTFTEDYETQLSDVIFFGKTLCHAWGRDSGGRPGDDVAYLKGEPTSGGSAKYWCSVVPKGSVVVLSNVPERFWKEYVQNDDKSDDLKVELVDEMNEMPNKGKLLEEKERLLARIDEIDKMLKSM